MLKEEKNAGKQVGDQKMEENNILHIIRGLAQAASNAYDGHDSEGNRIEVGLNREKGNYVNDKRMMDGFKVRFHGNKMIVSYHGEVNMKDIHKKGPKNFEDEMEAMFADILAFIKKEYKKVTGKSCKLKDMGEADSLIQRMSSIRNWVQSTKMYEIGHAGVESVEPEKKSLSENIKNFLAQTKK